MATSLLSAAEKSVYSAVMDDLHATHARDIIIVNETTNVNTDNLDENFNVMSDKKNSNITYTATETTIPARVFYMDKAESEAVLAFAGGQGDGSGGTTIPISQNYGLIRIKVDKQYNDLVKDSTKIIVDGEDCQLATNSTRKGLFDLNYTTWYLMRHT